MSKTAITSYQEALNHSFPNLCSDHLLSYTYGLNFAFEPDGKGNITLTMQTERLAGGKFREPLKKLTDGLRSTGGEVMGPVLFQESPFNLKLTLPDTMDSVQKLNTLYVNYIKDDMQDTIRTSINDAKKKLGHLPPSVVQEAVQSGIKAALDDTGMNKDRQRSARG